MITNYASLVAWIAENVPPENQTHDCPDGKMPAVPSADASAIWFFANQEADQLSDLSSRELAEYIQHGIGPIDEEYINSEFINWLSDGEEAYLDEDHTNLIDVLNRFFRLDATTADEPDDDSDDIDLRDIELDDDNEPESEDE